MNDEIEISAKADGLSVTSRGQGTKRIVDALCDLGSPFTETAGLIGDMVRAYRAENTERALIRAKEIALNRDVILQPPSPRFLLDWMEGTSLEEEGSELFEMWSGLLVAASQGHHSSHFLFKRFLRDFSPEHAKFLVYLCGTSNFEAQFFEADLKQPYTFIEERKWCYDPGMQAVLQLQMLFEEFKFYGVRPHKATLGMSHSYHSIAEDFAAVSDDQMDQFVDALVPAGLEAMGLVQTKNISQYDHAYQKKDLMDPNPHGLSHPVLISWQFVDLTRLGHEFLLASSGQAEKSSLN